MRLCVGPAEPFSLLKPTHYITTSGALASLAITPSTDLTGTASVPVGPNSPLESSPYTGLFGADANGDTEEQEIIIWDRLPRHDHFDIEMPSKVLHISKIFSLFLAHVRECCLFGRMFLRSSVIVNLPSS